MKNHSKPTAALWTYPTGWGDTQARSIRNKVVDHLPRSHRPQWDLPVFKSKLKPLPLAQCRIAMTTIKSLF